MNKFTKVFFFTFFALIAAVAGHSVYTSQKANPLSDLCLANVEALAMYEGDGTIDPNKAYGYKLTNCYDKSDSDRITGATCKDVADDKASCSYSSCWGKCK